MPVPLSSRPQTFTDPDRNPHGGEADEDARALRDSLGELAQHIEAATRARRGQLGPEAVRRSAEALAHCARRHQLHLTGLGSAWHALYEFGVYQRALRELRDALAQWQQALQQRSPSEAERFSTFERQAWRTLGEARLVLDIYMQGDPCMERSAPDTRPAAERPPRAPLLARLRRWWSEGRHP